MHAATAEAPQEAIRTRVLTLVASVYDVPLHDLTQPDRGSSDTAAARQVAIYLAHTVLAMGFADLASAFNRARSTTLYAVRRVEEMRDDPKIDQTLTWLEGVLRAAMEAGQ